MRSSNLTRAVFRAIISNRPYVVADCPRQARRSQLFDRMHKINTFAPRRTLFTALLGTLERPFEGAYITPQNLELALGKLVDLVQARRTNSRTPTDAELLDAFRFVFRARLESNRRLTRNEVYLVTESFKHFLEKGLVGGHDGSNLQTSDLHTILSTLALPSDHERFRTDSQGLATMVFQALPATPVVMDISSQNVQSTSPLLATYIIVLARTGSALEALQLLQPASTDGIKLESRTWAEVLKGLVSEARHNEFNAAVNQSQTAAISLQEKDYEDVICFCTAHGKLDQAHQMYDHQLRSKTQPSTTALCSLLELCARKGANKWGNELAAQLETRIDGERALGSLFIWFGANASGQKQLVREVEQFIGEALPHNLSIAPLNSLFEFGLQQNRQDITTAAMELAEALDLRPDGKTYALQMKHILDRGDISQAGVVYEQLVLQDIPADDSDIPVLNRLVAALAGIPMPPYALLTRVVDTILERSADFDAEALAGLCKVYLSRDELEEATGLLRHRAHFYPEAERARIASVFRDFILDRDMSSQRAYNAYELFKTAFPETSVELRLPLMQSFFDRNRPDLACQIFGDMRQREDPEARPDADAYAQCFAGIAQCRDVDGLQSVYNMLKLDLEVEISTRIRNALMLAYIATNQPYVAMIDHFWTVLNSREGPSYSTFEIGLRACETWVPPGGYEARKIMAVIQAWNLEITKELYDCYVGALAGQSEFEYTVELIEEMEHDIGEPPDAITIGTFYNAIPWQFRKEEVEKWAGKAYPELWAELLTYGDEIDEEWETRFFKIPRNIGIDDPPLFAKGKYDPQISRQAVKALEPPSK